jgi:hypothetical protein
MFAILSYRKGVSRAEDLLIVSVIVQIKEPNDREMFQVAEPQCFEAGAAIRERPERSGANNLKFGAPR